MRPTTDQSLLWSEAERIFKLSLELPEYNRQTFIESETTEDPNIRSIVEDLLRLHTQTLSLNQPLALTEVGHLLEEASVDEWIGRRLGNYRISEQLGSGGMGTVFLAERDDSQFDKLVAIKLIKANRRDHAYINHFIRERQLLASLDHPFIATLLDGGTTEEGLPYLVMEYIQGVPITQYCAKNNLNLKERISLFVKVARAVQFAHKNLIVHQDLKPSNILIDNDGLPKLLDFGIASLMSETKDKRQGNDSPRLLSPNYASPEQATGEEISVASDVYALGVLLYELLTGHTPFQLSGKSAADIQLTLTTITPDRPSESINPQCVHTSVTPRKLSEDIDHIILCALKKQVAQRYGSVLEMIQDIRRYETALPIHAVSKGPLYRLRKFCRRNIIAVITSISVFICLSIITALSIIQTHQIKEERDIAELEKQRAQQVTNFMASTFSNADPRNSGGKVVTAQDILTQARQYTERLNDRPLLKLSVLQMLTRSYYGLGDFQTARELAESMMSIVNRNDNVSSDQSAEVRLQYADILSRLGEASKVVGLTESVVEKFRATRQRRKLAEALLAYALALGYTNQTELAKSRLEEALGIYEELGIRLDANYARVLTYIANLEWHSGSRDRAIQLQHRSLELLSEFLPANDVRLIDAHRRRSRYLRELGRFDEAIHHGQFALRSYREVYGDDHVKVSDALNTLGVTFQRADQYDKATNHFLEALEIRRRVFGTEHTSTTSVMFNLGSVAAEQGHFADAAKHFKEVLDINEKLLEPDDTDLIIFNKNYGEALLHLGEDQNAERLLLHALRILEPAHYNDRTRHQAEIKSDLSELRTRQGQYVEALELQREALPILLEVHGQNDRRVLRMEKNQAFLIEKLKQ